MVHVSDGKSNPEPTRLKLTMELMILQRLDSSTPSTVNSEVRLHYILKKINTYFIVNGLKDLMVLKLLKVGNDRFIFKTNWYSKHNANSVLC